MFYRYFTYVSVILRAGGTWQYAILTIFVLRSYSNPPRAFIQTPSRLFMRATCTYTEIPSRSRNTISSILNPLQLFFGWKFFNHILEKVLDICKYHFAKVCSETAQPQKSQFFKNTLYSGCYPLRLQVKNP